jgi:hypothetical protein
MKNQLTTSIKISTARQEESISALSAHLKNKNQAPTPGLKRNARLKDVKGRTYRKGYVTYIIIE